MEFYRKIVHDSIQVRIHEDEDAALYAFKDGEPYYGAVRITVRNLDTKENVGNYYVVFEKEMNANAYNRFVQQFVEDPSFRQSYVEEEGLHWEGVIPFQNDKGVNKLCGEAIQRLLKTKDPSFKSFARLKTYGLDQFSKMKQEELERFLPSKDKETIQAFIEDEKSVLNAMRWCARGMTAALAIRKVKVDLEIQENIRGK